MLRPRSSLALVAILTATHASFAQEDAAYRAATGLLHRGMPEQASAEYRAFLREHPSHDKADSARYGLAVCLAQLGKWDHAGRELDALSGRLFEFTPDALLLRAQCHLQEGDSTQAVGCLRSLLKHHASFAQADSAAIMLAEVSLRAGKPDDSRALLSRFERDWPKSASRPRAELLLAAIEAGEGKDNGAADRLARLRADYPGSDVERQAILAEAQARHRLAAQGNQREGDRAAALYRSISTLDDRSIAPEAMLGLAQLIRASGKSAEAGRILDEALDKFSREPSASAARIERARVFLDEDKPQEALRILDPLLRNPSAESAYWAAKAELRLDRFADAAARLDAAAKRHADSPLLPEILFDRAVALARDDQPAASAYAEVRARFPKHPLAAEALAAEASLALNDKKPQDAIALCRAFLDSHDKHPRASTVRLILADAYSLAGKDDDAAAQYSNFISSNAQDPRAVDAALRHGLALARAGKTDQAAAILEQALNSPGQADESLRRAAHIILADAAIARADWPAAEKSLRLLTQRDAAPDAILKLGIVLQRQGRAQESLNLFTRLIDEHSSDPAAIQARFERAQLLAEQGNLEAARADFESVISLEKNADPRRFNIHTLRHLASIASRQNRADDAARLLAQVAASPEAGAAAADAQYEQGAALLAAGQYEEAESALSTFLSQSPAHPRAADAAAQRAIAISRQGHYEKALPQMDDAESRSAAMHPETLAALRYERAWALKTLGRLDDARAAYDRLLSSSLPPSLESHAALDAAQLHIAANQHAAALPLITRALANAESPLTPHALYLRAACELKLNKPAESAATLDDLLTRFPDSDIASPAKLLSGQALLKANKPEAAAARIESAISANLPADSLEPALLCLGEAHAAAQRWDNSRAAFEHHLRQFPKSEHWFQSQFGLAWALEHEGRHAEAIAAYRQVVDRHSGATAARAQFQIGECLFAMKQFDDAVRELLKVDILHAYPEWSAAALYEAGRCLIQLNKTAEARAQFTQVTERFKDTQWARLAAEQLQKPAAPALPGRAQAR